MKAQILCIGDIHLGNRPSRLPEDIGDYGIDTSELTPIAAWRSAVNWAIENDIDAVLLAGDVVENDDDRFEAYGHLKWGVEKLLAMDIPVLGVAGNHDYKALPRLAAQIPDFLLIGKNGEWEVVEEELKNGSRIRIVGWSFQGRYCREDPLRELELQEDREIPTLGLLHCDLDAAGSRYGPVSTAELERVPVDAWLLGHIHKPSLLSGPRPIGYLGSLSGLDPGEPGPHGPWLLTVDGPGSVAIRHLPMARMRWENIDLPLTGITGDAGEELEESVFGALIQALEKIHQNVGEPVLPPVAVGCRLTLIGRSKYHSRIMNIIREKRYPGLPAEHTYYFIDKVIDQASPDLDISRLVGGKDLPSVLARYLKGLEDDAPFSRGLVEKARHELRRLDGSARWAEVSRKDFDPSEAVKELLLKTGTRALEELLEQSDEN
ncbi:MAG: DNA repair exonuclease [Candidatus Auribacterota bacterium]|nr:DNA repair exonuclease [Candidatus Auribacterota bacterium]